MVYHRIFFVFGILMFCVLMSKVESAPTQSRQDVDSQRLALLLSDLNEKIDLLLRQLETARVSRNEDGSVPYKRNEDGNVPYVNKKNEDGSLPYKRNEDGSVPYLKERNEDGSVPYVNRQIHPKNEDGSIPYANSPPLSKGPDGDISLREMLKYLIDLERKSRVTKRDHDIPFPS